jgi:hypothetical protein
MSAPLIFVRDGRTLPYIPVTVAALAAIRELKQRRAYATATYIALLELANEDRSDRVAVTQREIIEKVGAGRTTVQAALADLQTVGVLVVQARSHSAGRIENEYVVVEPEGVSDIAPPLARRAASARHASDPRSPGEQRTQEEQQEGEELPKEEDAREQQKVTPNPRSAEVLAVLEDVEFGIRRVAAEKRSLAVGTDAVAEMLGKRARKPHRQAIEAWVHYYLYGNGRKKPVRDAVASYRNWVDKEADFEPRSAGGSDTVGSAMGRDRGNDGPAKLRAMAAALRNGEIG